METFAFRNNTPNTRRLRIDRFIMARDSLTDIRNRRLWRNKDETVDIWNIKSQQQKKYRNYLAECFNLDIPRRVHDEKDCVQPWPCVPRKRSCLASADNVLDLPLYSFATFPDILDWSSRNMLVAALGQCYHMFSWKEQSVTARGIARRVINCCKFHPDGTVLLIGTKSNHIELHDAIASKYGLHTYCLCYKRTGIDCTITALDWSNTSRSFVAGCSRGAVSAFNNIGDRISRWAGENSVILAVKVSPDTRYVAVSALNSSVINVLQWPSLKFFTYLDVNWSVKSIVWHPWRTALLGIGAVNLNSMTTIIMWDIPTDRLRKTSDGYYNHFGLDAMLFSHRTGELVVCLWDADRAVSQPRSSSQLIVMSDPYNVVDQSGEGRGELDRVQSMVFSPDGTKLATATSGEDLVIWTFLPEDKKKKPTRPKRFSALPTFFDEVAFGNLIR